MGMDTYVEYRDIEEHSQHLSSQLPQHVSLLRRECVRPLQSQSPPSQGHKAKRRKNISLFKAYL